MWPFNGKKERLKELDRVKAEMEGLKKKLEDQAETSILNSDILSTAPEYLQRLRQGLDSFELKQPKLMAGHAMDGGNEDLFNASKAAFTQGSSRVSELLMAWYVSQGFIGWQACGLMAQQWLVDAAVTTNAEAAAKPGWQVTVNDGEDVDPKKLSQIKKLDKKMRIKKKCVELDKHRKIFGIRIAMPLFRGDYDYEKPFNIDGVKKGSYKGFSQIDPYWITPQLDASAVADQSSEYFYEPTFWEVTIGKETIKVHRSHLVVARYSEVVDILKPTYIYGGLPLTQLIFERIYSAERTANEGPLLAASKRMTVLYQDLNAAVANPSKFSEVINQWAQFRDNFGVKIAGKGDTVQEFDTNLTGLDDATMLQYQIVAAIAKTPVSELMKVQLKGLNTTGEGERKSWHAELEKIQEDVYDPFLERHYELLIKSEFNGEFEVDVVWNKLEPLSDKELAETNKIKADTDTLLYNMGAIDGIEVRDRLITDESSGYNGLQPYEDAEELPDDGQETSTGSETVNLGEEGNEEEITE